MPLRQLARAASGRSRPLVLEGTVHPSFARVAEALRTQIESYGGGGAVCVYHHGECVVDIWGGERDRAGRLWSVDTMAPSFSTTKGVATTLLHILVDRGLLDYDDRVAEYWPGFAQAGKSRITIRQVLAHQSGLYHIRQMIDHASRMLDWAHMVEAIEKATPIHTPGERTGYHGLTYGFIVGELLQRVTGESITDLVQQELVVPLALDGLYIGAPAEALERAAQLMWPRVGLINFADPPLTQTGRVGALFTRTAVKFGQLMRFAGVQLDVESILDALAPHGISSFDFGSEEALRAAIPSGNGLFTARSLARMYAMLAGGGEIDGVRLLSPETVARATEPQGFKGPRSVIPFDMRWRLGYHCVPTTRGVPRRAFGHFGFGGSGAWAEPNRELAMALTVNTGMGTPFGDLRVVRIGGAVLASADARSPKRPVVAPMRKEPAPKRARATGTRRRTRPTVVPSRAAKRGAV